MRELTLSAKSFPVFPPRQLVDQLVEIADLPHHRLLDILHPHPADHPRDRAPRRVHPRRPGEEGLEIRARFQLGRQRVGAVGRSARR
jgi:hypothetical protein